MNERPLAPNTTCYREVLERLSHRLSRVLSEVDRYYQQQEQSEGEKTKKKKNCEDTNSAPMAMSSTVSTPPWPSLQVQPRVSGLQECLGEHKELWKTMQRLDTAIRQLRTEALIDLRHTSGPCVESSSVDMENEGRDCSVMNNEEGKVRKENYFYHLRKRVDMLGRRCPYNSSGSDREETARWLVRLQQQHILHGDEVYQLYQRASRAYDKLNSHFDKTPGLCEEVFTLIGDSDDNGDEHDMAKLHALCRRNEERARGLQERLTRILEKYHRVVAHANMELCRLDLELQAIEQQSSQTEDENMLQLLRRRDNNPGAGITRMRMDG